MADAAITPPNLVPSGISYLVSGRFLYVWLTLAERKAHREFSRLEQFVKAPNNKGDESYTQWQSQLQKEVSDIVRRKSGLDILYLSAPYKKC